jgi:tRNA (mo5U34)-methyltransferase
MPNEVTMSDVPWNAERVRKNVQKLGPWFHNMRLLGVETAPEHFLGDYPRIKWERFSHAMPNDLAGRSVLDVGCNAGFYSIEMKRRGASRVVGIDTDPGYLAQARFAAEVNDVNIDFRRMSVYEVAELGERFDIVLFLGVLYHLRHPLLALDLLYHHVVGDELVFQSMLRGSHALGPLASDYPFSERRVFDEPSYPCAYLVENSYAGDPTNWWIPNQACAEAMLRSSGFEITEHPEEEVYICRRAQREWESFCPDDALAVVARSRP